MPSASIKSHFLSISDGRKEWVVSEWLVIVSSEKAAQYGTHSRPVKAGNAIKIGIFLLWYRFTSNCAGTKFRLKRAAQRNEMRAERNAQ